MNIEYEIKNQSYYRQRKGISYMVTTNQIIKKKNARMKFEFFGPHNIDILFGIFGSLLGDSFAKKRSGKCFIRLKQASSNQEYLFAVHHSLSSGGYCSELKPKEIIQIGKNNKAFFYRQVTTYSFASFNWLHEAFYQDGIKRIPRRELLEVFLTSLALASWICDDGTAATSGGVIICTHCFSIEDISMICEFLNDKYGLRANPQKAALSKDGKQQYKLYIWKQSIPILITIAAPFMVSSMLRKLHVKP
jgi:hypothetical protein